MKAYCLKISFITLSKPNLTDELMNINEMYKSTKKFFYSSYIYSVAKPVCFVPFLYKLLISI